MNDKPCLEGAEEENGELRTVSDIPHDEDNV